MKCPHCGDKLLQKSGTRTRLRIRGAVEFDENGVCKSQCFWCHQPVTVPVELRKAADDEEKFILVLKTPA